MRIWHKDFITVLPREQLVSQWRELSAIAGSIQKNGTPNHLLVNFVLDYDLNHFISYTKLVHTEMLRRQYRPHESVWHKIASLKPNWKEVPYDDIYDEKMDDEYFKICYYNLREKYLCDGITDDDWELIALVYLQKFSKGKEG